MVIFVLDFQEKIMRIIAIYSQALSYHLESKLNKSVYILLLAVLSLQPVVATAQRQSKMNGAPESGWG